MQQLSTTHTYVQHTSVQHTYVRMSITTSRKQLTIEHSRSMNWLSTRSLVPQTCTYVYTRESGSKSDDWLSHLPWSIPSRPNFHAQILLITWRTSYVCSVTYVHTNHISRTTHTASTPMKNRWKRHTVTKWHGWHDAKTAVDWCVCYLSSFFRKAPAYGWARWHFLRIRSTKYLSLICSKQDRKQGISEHLKSGSRSTHM